MTDDELLYHTVLGHIRVEYPTSDGGAAFLPDYTCAREHARVTDAYVRLCERLGIPCKGPDADVEQIIDALSNIREFTCIQMFGLGMWFQKKLEEDI